MFWVYMLGDQLWTKLFFMYRSSSLTEAYCSPEKGWWVCVGLLVAHLLNVEADFCHDSLQAAAELVAGPADVWWRQLVPFLGDGQMQGGPIVMKLAKPAKRYKWRSPAALTNMAANPPGSQILPLFSQEVLGGLAMWASFESCWKTELSSGYVL